MYPLKIEEYIMHPIIIILNAIEDIMNFVVTAWIYLAQCAIIVLIFMAVIPNSWIYGLFGFNVSWFEFTQGLADIVVIAPAVFVFEFFVGTAEYFRAAANADGINGLEAFANMCGMLGSIILMLGLPAAFWFMHVMFGFVALARFIMTPELWDRAVAAEKRNDNIGIFDKNDFYLMTGRTTINEVYNAEVEATAIASALKK